MEFSQLKYFMVTANCGKIVQAANTLHVSQSTISMSISRLEEELGVALFEKKGRNITLTEQGSRFLSMITPAISELEYAKKDLQTFSTSHRTPISLSIEMPDFATALEFSYQRLHPNVLFSQSMDNIEQAKHKVLCASVDFCLGMAPINEPNIENLHLFSDPVLIQVSDEHPLAHRQEAFLYEFADSTIVSFSQDYGFRKWMDTMCIQSGFKPNVFIEVCDTQSLLRMVSKMNAVSFIAESTATWNYYTDEKNNFDVGNVHAIPLRDKHCIREVYLIYNKKRILSEEAKRFLEFAIQFRDQYQKTHNILNALHFS